MIFSDAGQLGDARGVATGVSNKRRQDATDDPDPRSRGAPPVPHYSD